MVFMCKKDKNKKNLLERIANAKTTYDSETTITVSKLKGSLS